MMVRIHVYKSALNGVLLVCGVEKCIECNENNDCVTCISEYEVIERSGGNIECVTEEEAEREERSEQDNG